MNSSVTTESTSESQGLRDLTRGVLDEAQAEAHQIVEDAKAEAASTRQKAQEEADARRQEVLQRASREVEPVRSQAVASAQIQAQRLRLESRERLLDDVFSTARETLRSAPQWPDYADILRRLIAEAAASLAAEEVIVRADERTQEHLTDVFLGELETQLGVRLRRGEVLNNGDVGIVVETPNGRRRYRDTLQARLERLQDRLRAPVYRLLQGVPSE